MQEKNPNASVKMKAAYTTTNAWADIYSVNAGDFSHKITESGDYDLKGQCSVYLNTNGDGTGIRLAVNSFPVGGTQYADSSASLNTCPFTLEEWQIKLKVDDVVSLQAKYSGSSTVVKYDADLCVGTLTIRKCP